MRPSLTRRAAANTLFRLGGACILCALSFYLILRFSAYPALDAFLARPYSVRYYDREGSLVQIPPLAEADSQGLRREWLSREEWPAALARIFVFAEDRRFFRHGGVDPLAVLRAAAQNFRAGREVSGASTITMQLSHLVSSAYAGGGGRGRRTWGAKCLEAFDALRLEARLSKDAILELYLNNVPFGFQAEGAASAARTFFAADVRDLTAAQMFALAVIPRRPAAYNPLESAEACFAAARALARRCALASSGLPEPDEAAWEYARSSARRFAYPFEAPHYIRFLSAQGTQEARGSGRERGTARLSLDLTVQRRVEDLVAANVARYWTARVTNGAALVLDNESGEVLAWVGSADYANESAAGQIDGMLALNQMGSSMKPFLYALALESGIEPAAVLADVPSVFGAASLYIPQNFNNRFNGPVLLRTALASSLNVPAVRLLERLGVARYADFLRTLGFASLDFPAPSGQDESAATAAGLGLALGNAPVSLRELTRAFSVFARDGEGFMAPDTARLVAAFLSDRKARSLGFGTAPVFETPFPAMFKTGTANQYQSIVALGATRRFTVGVWMGNFTGETVVGKTGSGIPAAIVRDTLVFLHGNRPPRSEDAFPQPAGYELVPVCALSGMTPTPDCLSVVKEYALAGRTPPLCTWHRPGQVVYPPEYQGWFTASGRQGAVDWAAGPLTLVTPGEGYVFYAPASGEAVIPVEAQGGAEETLVLWLDGNAPLTLERPFACYLNAGRGTHVLTARCGEEEERVTFCVE